MIARFLLCLLCSLVFPALRAHAAPAWVDQTPKADSSYRYYVGRSAPAPSEAQAFREAMKDATEQAVRDAFGMVASVSSEAYQTERETRGTVRLFERSKEVRVEGFSRMGQHIERSESGTVVWVLCRYEEAAIDRERLRQARAAPESGVDSDWSVAGGVPAENQTRLRISSEPAGARVVIAGEVYGKTPVLIRGQLSAGPVQILVDHPAYEPKLYEVILAPGEPRELHAALVRARGILAVASVPSGAQVEVNGIDFGITPIAALRLEAGSTYEVRLSHPAAEPVTQAVTIERGVSRQLEIRLPLRPARVAYMFEPVDALVSVDGKESESLASIQLAPGLHRIRATRPGYAPYSREISVGPGEVAELGQVRMTSLSEEELRRERSPWILSMDFGAQQSPVSAVDHGGVTLGTSLEKRFFRRITFGVRAGLAYHFSGFDESTEYYTHETRAWEIGAHAMLRVHGGLHLLAERGVVQGVYTFRVPEPENGDVPVQKTKFSTDYTGYGVAWEFSSARIAGVVRTYPGTGNASAAVLRISLFTKW